MKLSCYCLLLTVSVIGLSSAAFDMRDSRCPNGFFRIDRQCFRADVSRPRGWWEAMEACIGYGGELATPKDAFKLQKELKKRYGNARFWVGGTDEEREGEWNWVSGDARIPIDPKYWKPNQPNNCCGGENCATLGTAWTPPLNDNGCTVRRNFVCQVPALNMGRIEMY